MRETTIYWAGQLFNMSERNHNRRCASILRRMGYKVILPQEDAEKFRNEDGSWNLTEVALDCAKNATHVEVVAINLDGPDVDSGTSVEAGIRIGMNMRDGIPTGLLIGWRSDFRLSEDKVTGTNAMFRLLQEIVRVGPDSTEEELCEALHARIQECLS